MSLIDYLVQEVACYSTTKNKNKFIDFLLKYSSREELKAINYITLYYEYEESFKQHNISIDRMFSPGCIYTLKSLKNIFPKTRIDFLSSEQILYL